MLSAYKNTAYVLLGGALCKAWQLIFSCFSLCALVKRCLGSGMLFGVVLNLGVIGVWMAMGMDWMARSVAFTLRYKSGKWKTIKIINKRSL